MLILLWGIAGEAPLAEVTRALQHARAPFVVLDQRAVRHTRVHLSVGRDIRGSVKSRDLHVALNDIGAVYLRPYESHRFTSVRHARNSAAARARAAAVDDTLLNWCNLTSALVLNRPRSMASNNCKPYQAEILRRHGFRVPHTLLTTSASAARAFQQQHGAVIYKSISGTRSRVTRLRSEHDLRLAHVASCPTQFQEFVPGQDVRVHVVGSDVFASELHCDADDYRYPGEHPLVIRRARVPAEIEDRCIRVAAAMDLPLAGIDLRRTPAGEWFCFEVNPSPAFTFYQERTGQPIAAAIASLLLSHVDPSRSSSHPLADTGLPDFLAMDPALSLAPIPFWEI